MFCEKNVHISIMGIFILFTGFLVMGCATHRVQSVWQPAGNVTIDGIGDDWEKIPPQYYDEDDRVSIRTTNNDDSLIVCVTVGSRQLSRNMLTHGMTLTLGLGDDEDQQFALVVKGQNEKRRPDAKSQAWNKGSEQGPGIQGNLNPQQSSRFFFDITYPGSPGPIMMSCAEAREKGIDAAMGENKYGQMVFEAHIQLDAVSLPQDITPTTRVILGVAAAETDMPFESGHGGLSGQGGAGGPQGGGLQGGGGGPQGGGGGPQGGKPSKGAHHTFTVKLDVTLSNASNELH